ncbi:ParA family protein [Streptosporangium sandarakinum]|uniref:ParA family protein n=1 Tax=Streptosporangium sandarakinum TaxID=1260955 RepID=UPI0036D20761
MLAQAIAYLTGKGGAGKTSVSGHTAYYAATYGGYRTLIIDMDPVGSLRRDFGYMGADFDDDGEALADALSKGRPVQPVNIRPRLDVVVGGVYLRDLLGIAVRRGADFLFALGKSLEPVADQYDLIVIDCPPGEELLQKMAVAAARNLVVTTKADEGSLDAAEEAGVVAGEIMELTGTPRVLLGAVAFDFDSGAPKLRAEVRRQLQERLGGAAPILGDYVRHVPKVAVEIRKQGKTAFELAEDPQPGIEAGGLAEDYGKIAVATITRLVEVNSPAGASA